MTLEITIDNVIRFNISAELKMAYPQLMSWLRADLIIDNPVFIWAKRKNRSTFRIPAKLTFFKFNAQTGDIALPRGYQERFFRHLEACGISYHVSYNLAEGQRVTYNSAIQLRDYQVPAVEKAVEMQGGLIEAPCGSGKCLAENSLVFTDKGIVQLGELLPNNVPNLFVPHPFTVDSRNGAAAASGIYDGGYSDTVRAVLRYGYEVEGTPEHPVLIFNGDFQWKRLENLSCGDFMVLKRGTSVWGSSPETPFVFHPKKCTNNLTQIVAPRMTVQAARAIGLLVAEGMFSASTSVAFSNSEEENVAVVRQWIESLGLTLKKKPGDNCDYYVCSVQLRDYLQHIGASMELSATKVIPRAVREGGKEVCRAFLQGYIEGEASVEKSCIEVSSASKRLLQQTQTLLLGFGILSSLSYKFNTVYNKNYYRLVIYELERFSDEIGFITKRKQEALAAALEAREKVNANPNMCVIPHLSTKLQRIYEAARNTDKWHYRDERMFGNYLPRCKRSHRPSRTKIQRILDKYGDLPLPEIEQIRNIVQSDFEFLPVKTLEKGHARVIDLTVPETHSYVGNGVVCHNTQMGLEIIARHGQNAVWLTHTHDLANQVIERAQQCLGLTKEQIGLYGGGKREIGTHLTVALIPTLAQPDCRFPYEQFGVVLIDEVHHSPAGTWSPVINKFPAVHRYGVTATLERADGLEIATHLYVGPTVYKVTPEDVKDAGGTIIPKLIVHYTECKSAYWDEYQAELERVKEANKKAKAEGKKEQKEPSFRDYNGLLTELIANPDRNALIINLLATDGPGHYSLVLSDRVAHCRLLCDLLKYKAPELKAAVISGTQSKADRQRIIDEVKEGKIQVLFAVDIAKEGLDIPRLDRLYLVAGGRNEAELIQKVGRIMRPAEGKTDARIIDIVDGKIDLMKGQYYARRRVYRRLGIIS